MSISPCPATGRILNRSSHCEATDLDAGRPWNQLTDGTRREVQRPHECEDFETVVLECDACVEINASVRLRLSEALRDRWRLYVLTAAAGWGRC